MTVHRHELLLRDRPRCDRIERQAYGLGIEVRRRHRRDGSMLNTAFDLIGAVTVAAIFGVALWMLK
jgi:hypothetical protein